MIVEGYMDVISLHQRGIKNVVAPLGTALTEQQGWLLRKSTEKIILSFDSDEAGLNAKIRALDILQNMGCDIRILQMEGAKDPDEFIIKYGNVRFQNLVQKALSVVEFKVKILKKDLNLDNVNDKIKFLNEIAKLIAKIDNTMEKEVYIDKIALEYSISKEAIYAEVNKLIHGMDRKEKSLEKTKPVLTHQNISHNEVSEAVKTRENMIISLLLIGDFTFYEIIKQNVKIEDFQYELNRKIAQKLYEEFEKGNSNINSMIDKWEEAEQNHITEIMVEDTQIEDMEKAIDDVIRNYQKEKLKDRKMKLIELIEQETDSIVKKRYEEELMNVIHQLTKIR